MTRLTGVLIGGIAVGLLIGTGVTMSTDDKQRRRMMRESKRAIKKAGHFIEDIF